jgi:hypothetical protein
MEVAMSRKKRGRFPGDQWIQRKVENLMRKTLREQQAHGKMRGTTVEDLRGTAWYGVVQRGVSETCKTV